MSPDARKQHLTDVEFADLLAGAFPGKAAEAHLAACEYCRREFQAVQTSLGSFQQLGAAWAQLEAPRRVTTPSRVALHLGMRPSWGAGLAATAMGALLAFGLGMPTAHTRPEKATAAPVSVAPTNAELANDNRLMLSIDEELNDQAQPAVPASQLRSQTQRTEHRADAAVLD